MPSEELTLLEEQDRSPWNRPLEGGGVAGRGTQSRGRRRYVQRRRNRAPERRFIEQRLAELQAGLSRRRDWTVIAHCWVWQVFIG